MRTAESIINEYLAQGYSLESLRVLAESRSEPLRSDMLARIESMRGAPGASAAPAAVAPSQSDEPLFFVAADEESVGDEGGVDFDIMAETDSGAFRAATEESVAEIVVGETEGSEVVAEAEESVAEVMVQEPEPAPVAAPAAAPEPVAETAAPNALSDSPEETFCEEVPSDIMAESSEIIAQEQASSAIIGQAEDGEVSDYMPGSRMFNLEPVKKPMAEFVAEPEAETKTETEAEAETPVEPEAEAQQEDMVAKAQQALLAAQEAVTTCLETALAPIEEAPAQPEEQDNAHQESRRERRRRERAQKRKKKKSKHAEADLPEIVMTRSEGTETLIPEMAEMTAAAETAPALSGDEMSETAPGEFIVAERDAMLSIPLAPEEPEATPVAEQMESGAEALLEDGGMPLSLAFPEEKDEPADAENGLADHMMILANGGIDFRSEVYSLLTDEASAALLEEEADAKAEAESEPEAEQDNVILFRQNYEMAEADDDAADESAEEAIGPVLHLLESTVSESSADADAEAEREETEEERPVETGLSPMDRLGLLRALVGAPEPEDCAAESESSPEVSGHAIVTPAAELVEPPSAAEIAAAVEKEYQERVDSLAQLMLEVQGQLAESEKRCRAAQDEIGERDGDIRNLKERLAAREKIADDAAAELAKAKNEGRKKDERLNHFEGMHREHERLYGEYEDLRKAYNEVVTDVMPALQNERDELTVTVERQGVERDEMSKSLGSARRRVAVSYALSAAACVMLVALPVMNWLRADGGQRSLALNHQQSGDLVQRLEKAEMLNVEYDKTIYNLSYQVDKMAEEAEKLRHRNTELAKLAEGKGGRTGSPTRASTMALAGPVNGDGKLQRNDVRDPGGNIDRVVARNREIYDNEVQAPIGVASTRVPVSAVAVNTRSGNGNNAATLRPPAGNAGARATAAANAREPEARKDETVATVKSGEGVAQVVYRVLGTRDPEVIAWVIRENKIKNDKRGNPRIYPDQKLRLPQNGGSTQSASAARR